MSAGAPTIPALRRYGCGGHARTTTPPRASRTAFALAALALALTPALSHGTDRPRLVNEREVLEPLMFAMMRSGLVADGTASAGVDVTPDGKATPRALYGGVPAANPRLAELVREATDRARFLVPSEWSRANPRGGWAVFWAFQTNGCTPWSYDAPARATVIRVCLSVVDGRVDPDTSSYLVDADPTPTDTRAPKPRYVPSRSNPYPHAAREQGAQGHVTFRLRLDEHGRIAAADIREHTAGPLFQAWLERWRAETVFEIPAGWPPTGEPRSLDMRLAFAIAPRLGSDCPWVLPRFDGVEHRICTSPISARP